MSELELNDIKWPEISRPEWEQKLKKELKTEDLDKFKAELERGIVYDPFKSRIDIDKQQITHWPVLSYGQRFDFNDDETLNKCLLGLMQNDLRVVSINAKNVEHWSVVLNEIFVQYIHLDIEYSSKYDKQKFDSYRKSSQHDKWSVSSNMPEPDTINLNYREFHSLSQVELLRSALWDAGISNKQKVKVSFSIGENLLEIVPFSRALRIAFEKQFPSKQLIIEANCDLPSKSTDKNDALIRAGSVYMFCSMAGIDHVYLHTLSNEEDFDHARLLLNIQNILSLESHIDDKKDPLKGSYVIEDLTTQFLDAAT